jgi:prepilin-type processing-associated H-X9-DG protein
MSMIMKSGSSSKIAALMGTLLVTTSCSAIDFFHEKEESQQTSQVLQEEEGQLLRYCKKLHRNSDLIVAAGMCQRAHEVDPADPEPLLELGVILNKLGQRQQAVEAYRMVLKGDPGNPEARYGLGKTYIGLGEHDLAMNQFNALFADGHHDPRIYNAAGVSQGLKGDHVAAQAMFRSGLEKAPDDIKLRNNLGLAYVNNGDLEQGIAYLEATARLPIADSTTRRNLQIAYSKAQASGYVAGTRQGLDDLPQHAELGVSPVEAAPATSGSTAAVVSSTQLADSGNSDIGGYLSADIDNSKGTGQPVQIASRSDDDAKIAGFQSADLPETDAALPKASEPMVVANADPATPLGGDFAVQLAAFRDEDTARESWIDLKSKAPDLLNEIKPVVLRADLGAEKGVYYRLRTSAMPRQDAEALCGNLQERDMDCMVVRSARQGALNS